MKKLYNVFYVNNDQGGFEDFNKVMIEEFKKLWKEKTQ